MPEEPAIEVWPENWPVVQLFLAVGTCWWIDGTVGRYLGLDYSYVAVVMKFNVKKKQRPKLFADLQIMERAVLAVVNKQTD